MSWEILVGGVTAAGVLLTAFLTRSTGQAAIKTQEKIDTFKQEMIGRIAILQEKNDKAHSDIGENIRMTSDETRKELEGKIERESNKVVAGVNGINSRIDAILLADRKKDRAS